ncbi:surface protein P113, putative [Plasmodium gallinaceum]|uniref:Surface protein P113, putative n=1 Tax=Plasmodium gallinaceum TaxID=5849 RepID=A0A1J1GTV0_PLAGA|nr:surface protein P113, putative [Plasmodium gallinaceum]CRG95721.1 surface protein P113, putative [Plasmodium gallinaceum]
MKSFFFSLCFLLLAIFLPTNCLVHNDIIKFGEENSLKCSIGQLYILHCEVLCMNDQNHIIYKNCLDEVEKKCSGNKCLYYFDYMRKNTHAFRNKNSIEVSECVESDINEIKTSTTCLLSNSFLLEELNTQYFFFIKNKNNDPVVCQSGIINVNSATLHSPFCEIKLRDISSHIRKECDDNKDCLINPIELPKSLLGDDNPCYINNSYVSLNIICRKNVIDEYEEEEYDKGDDDDSSNDLIDPIDNEHEYLDKVIIGENDEGNKNDSKEINENEKQIKKQYELYLQNKEAMKENVNIKKNLLNKKKDISIKLEKAFSKKEELFKKLADRISNSIDMKHEPFEVLDLLEDRYNELKRNSDYSFYYDFVIETLGVNDIDKEKIDNVKVTILKNLKEYLGKIGKVEKIIGEHRKKYISIFNESKQYLFNLFDEDVDEIINYDNFPHHNGMISSNIFFKYYPESVPMSLEKINEKGKLDEEELREFNDIEELDVKEKKNKICELRKRILQNLRALYLEKNEVFNTQAMCIKAYCYKNPLNLKNFKNFMKEIYYLSKVNSDSVLLNVVRYLNAVGDKKKSWSNRRRLNKLIVLLFLGFRQVKEKEIEIDKEIERYNILYDLARSINLQELFVEKDNILKKYYDLNRSNDFVGSQSTTFDFIDKTDKSMNEEDKEEKEEIDEEDKEKEETDEEDKEKEETDEEDKEKDETDEDKEKDETDEEDKEKDETDEEDKEEKDETDKEDKEEKDETDEEDKEEKDETDEEDKEEKDETGEEDKEEKDEADEEDKDEVDEEDKDEVDEEDKDEVDEEDEEEADEEDEEEADEEDKEEEEMDEEDKEEKDETIEDINEDKEETIEDIKEDKEETNEDIKGDKEEMVEEVKEDKEEIIEEGDNGEKIEAKDNNEEIILEENMKEIKEEEKDDETDEDVKEDEEETLEEENEPDELKTLMGNEEEKLLGEEKELFDEDVLNELSSLSSEENEDIIEDEIIDESLDEKNLLDVEQDEGMNDNLLKYINEIVGNKHEEQDNEKNEKDEEIDDDVTIKGEDDENIEDTIKIIKKEDNNNENNENIVEETTVESGEEYITEQDIKGTDKGSSFFLTASNSLLIILVVLFIETLL